MDPLSTHNSTTRPSYPSVRPGEMTEGQPSYLEERDQDTRERVPRINGLGREVRESTPLPLVRDGITNASLQTTRVDPRRSHPTQHPNGGTSDAEVSSDEEPRGPRPQRRHGAQPSSTFLAVPTPQVTGSDAEDWWSFRRRPEHTIQSIPEIGRGAHVADHPPTNPEASSTPGPAIQQVENMLAQLTAAFTQLVNKTNNTSTNNAPLANPRPTPYLFFGHEEEDPEWFLIKMEEYFRHARISSDGVTKRY